MDNQDILQRIQALVDEEHQLREPAESGSAGGAVHDGSLDAGGAETGNQEERLARLAQVEAALDQCWDLLRQRRAKAKAGEDPNEADARPVSEVEGYAQ
jgi:hypothetical protein